ncbi:MAG: hypothetical protein WDO13_05060 [Verrucomicrobiota bacterium]
MARAIAVYLENDWVAPRAAAGPAARDGARSLEGIGFEDIARKSLIVPPRVSISLMEIALRAPLRDRVLPAAARAAGRRAGGAGRRRKAGGSARLQQGARRGQPLAPHLYAHQRRDHRLLPLLRVCKTVPRAVDLVIH